MSRRKLQSLIIEKGVYLALIGSVGLFILYPYIVIFYEGLIVEEGGLISYLGENWQLLKNSLFVAGLTTIFSLFFVICLTVCFIFLGKKLQRVMRLVFLITMVSPPFVTALAYITLFGMRGLITHDLLHLTYNPYGPQGIIMMQTMSYASLNTLVLMGMVKNIDPTIIKSARSLGATPDAIIKDMFLPLLKPGLIVVALISFIRSLADFQTPTIIGGNYRVLASEGYFAVISQGDIHKAALINLTLCIPALFFFYFYTKYEKKIAQQNHGLEQGNLSLPRKGFSFYGSSVISVLFIFFMTAQYMAIAINAVTVKRGGKLFLSLRPILESRDYIDGIVLRTIVYSLIAGFVGSLLSFLIIYFSQVKGSKVMRWVELVGTLPYLLPGTFFGLGYLYAFSSGPLKMTGTALIVVLNVTFKQLAFATKAARAASSQIDDTYYKTVHDLGGFTINEWQDVFFPMSKQGFALTFINGFISTMTTIGSIIFLITPGQKMLTLVMFDVVQRGKYGIASVLAWLIIFICLAVAGVIYGGLKLSERRRFHVS